VIRNTLFAFAFLTFGSVAHAQVASIPQFGGQASDGFETQAALGMSGFQPCLIGRAFSDFADVCTPISDSVHLTSGWSYGCQLQEYAGASFLGSTGGGYMDWVFDSTITRFGGFFATNTPDPGVVTIRFYGASSNLLATELVDVTNDCLWVWNGWETTGEAIKSIQVQNSINNGGFVMFDDMQIDIGPTALGTNYCQSAANSMDANGATISATGSTSLAAANLELITAPVPDQPFAYMYGPTQVNLPFGNGFRCVDGGIVTMPVDFGLAGEMRSVIDFGAHGANLASMGTVCFQCWYRDPLGGGAYYNLSDGLEIIFTP
jgi:hypothetical protein